jgi:sugar-specific transcriptional regulator TrmB
VSDVQDEDIEALVSLGLTMLQAKVYLALVESENSTIKDIARDAGVARQDLYRITSELQEYGLVEQIITKPIMYKAISLTSGVNVLLNELQRKRSESHKKVAELLQRYKTKEVTAKAKVQKNQFVLVPGKNALILKEKEMLNTAQKSVSIITSKQRFSQKFYSLAEEFKKAAAKGVKIRILMEKSEPEKHSGLTSKPAKSYKENPYFEVRFISAPTQVVMTVFDNKEVIIVASAKAGLTESPALWSNNPSLVELAYNYFEILWITAIEYENQVSLEK